MKKIVIISIIWAFLITAGVMSEPAKINIYEVQKALTGAEPLLDLHGYPLNPNFVTQSPGVMVGTTWYDQQTNGSTGNRIAVCDDGSIYVCWMNALQWQPPPRHVYFNWRDAYGDWAFEMGCQVDDRPDSIAAAGYTTLDVYQGYHRAIAFHYTVPSYVTRLAVNELFNVPNMYIGREHIWPYIAVDRNESIHILMTYPAPVAGDPQDFIYVRSEDGGENWTIPQIVDTLMCLSSVIDASPVSDKVIIAYTHPTTYDNQWENDVMYILSEDGVYWDFRNGKINVTDYANDDDSLWAYTDMDVIFDYNDNLHLIWNAQTIDTEGYIQWNTRLFHYNGSTGEINLVHMWPLDDNWIVGCDCGGWGRPICKMNLGVNESNMLFATWTQFDTTDCSQYGYANGDIHMAYTFDGTNWSTDTNLTNTQTPDCEPGECDSDHWSTLADVVDDTLHIFYINDKDAGSTPKIEGCPTESPVMYLAVPVDTIVGINEKIVRPAYLSLNQNYPNPFNAETNISFELKEPSPVLLEVFDITGAKVITLVDEYILAGSHSITWNAENLASGIYYYRLKAGNSSETRRAVLIK